MANFIAYVRGIPTMPHITHVRVRTGPGTANAKLMDLAVGTDNMQILQVQSDSANAALNGKTYQWFQVVLPGGARGWIRDDLLDITGNGSQFGYPSLAARTFAFALTRQSGATRTATPAQPTVQPTVQPTTQPTVQPTTAQPTLTQPTLTQPAAQPTVTQSTTTTVTQPTTQPTRTQPTLTQPTVQPAVQPTVQPTLTQPTLTQPTLTQPTLTQPTLTQPTTTAQPTLTQPTTTAQPTLTQPATTTLAQPGGLTFTQPAAATTTAAPAGVTIGMTGTPSANCRVRGARLRSGPGTNHPMAGTMNFDEDAPVLDITVATDGNTKLQWVKMHYNGKEVWTREDFVRLSGDVSKFGFPVDLYPSPAPESYWERDFDPKAEFSSWPHDGWDQSGRTGAPLIGGPNGGVVVKTALCQSCGAEGASVEDKGLQVGSRQVFTPAWNYGYGHYVIVRYDNNILPASTQKILRDEGRDGQHIFVMYAHCHRLLVQQGQTLTPNANIATMGNSGNSTGTHLHLELRIGSNPNAQWSQIKDGLRTPGILFYR